MKCSISFANLDIFGTIPKTMGIMVITTSSAEKSVKYPMAVLSAKLLERVSDIWKTFTDNKFVSGFFYSSLSTAIELYHLLTAFI